MNLKYQRGVALLIALFAVALATVLIAGMLDRGELAAARTRNALRAQQAEAFAQGLEAYAARVLLRDRENGDIDANGDLWTVPLPPTQVAGGTISATMIDRNGCFNLNNLASASIYRAIWQQRFERMLQALGLDPSLGVAVADWLGADSAAGDGSYLAQEPPYRPARRPFAHVSELRLVRGINGPIFGRLAPHVCALPVNSELNLNTATVPVLRSLASNLTEPLAQRLWSDGKARWSTPQEVFRLLRDQGVEIAEIQGLSVRSDYFLARGDIVLDDLAFVHFSLVERSRSGAGLRVLQRSRGTN